jgi:hypothetical protein
MSGMCCEHLVCANCARPVVQAGCSTCRATRVEMHGTQMHGTGAHGLTAALLAVLVTALLAAAAVLYGHFAG